MGQLGALAHAPAVTGRRIGQGAPDTDCPGAPSLMRIYLMVFCMVFTAVFSRPA